MPTEYKFILLQKKSTKTLECPNLPIIKCKRLECKLKKKKKPPIRALHLKSLYMSGSILEFNGKSLFKATGGK